MAGLAAFMALCGLAGVGMQAVGYERPVDHGGWEALMGAAAITAVFSFAGWRFGRTDAPRRNLSRRDATFAVALIWAGVGLFGGLPFVLGAGLTPVDSFFEAASGFTTTGATIIHDIEGQLARPLLLWRSLIQWLGGMGIVVLFVAVFPNVGVGGKHMFRSEVPGPTAEGVVPRIKETSLVLWGIYAAITALLIALLTAIGWWLPPRAGVAEMDLFSAVCHAFATASTGGFSPLNASIAAFDSALIELTITVFMLVGGVNFGLFYGALASRSLRVFLRSTEFKAYVLIIVVTTLLLTLLLLDRHPDPFQAFRYASFTMATFLTSTGFITDDYMAYPSAAVGLILLLMFVGSMSGSTAGGIKISRVVLLGRSTWAEVRRSVRPSVVQVVRMSGRTVPQPVLTEVAVFFFIYMFFLAAGVVFVCFVEGVSPQQAFGANLTALSNMGPAPFYDRYDHFADYTDASKVWLSFAMILGRLEFFTLLALLLPDFWRR